MEISKVKSAIIGKMWDNKGEDSDGLVPQKHVLKSDMTFEANQSFLLGEMTFRTDRNLPRKVTVKEGASLNFYANKKREGKQDADYSVSIILPEKEADELIDGAKANAEKWRADNQ